MIRKCTDSDFESIYRIINNAAATYKGIIPDDRWHEPYMPRAELEAEIRDGVVFWCLEEGGNLVGVMGIQDKGGVNLVRHSYVLTSAQRKGVGRKLLHHLRGLTENPMLIGTWRDATWAVSFYEKNGYTLLHEQEKNRLLRKYWSIPERQVETSVVLADRKWMKLHYDDG
jgi:GNAT superfamily N-acetyltransferase